jgi:hypothetical protein
LLGGRGLEVSVSSGDWRRCCGGFTKVIDIIFALGDILLIHDCSDIWFFAYCAVTFTEDDEFVAGDIVFLDGLANDFFRNAVRVDVCGIPLLFVNQMKRRQLLEYLQY